MAAERSGMRTSTRHGLIFSVTALAGLAVGRYVVPAQTGISAAERSRIAEAWRAVESAAPAAPADNCPTPPDGVLAREIDFLDTLEAATSADLERMWDQCLKLPAHERDESRLWLIAERWAQIDPAGAVKFLADPTRNDVARLERVLRSGPKPTSNLPSPASPWPPTFGRTRRMHWPASCARRRRTPNGSSTSPIASPGSDSTNSIPGSWTAT